MLQKRFKECFFVVKNLVRFSEGAIMNQRLLIVGLMAVSIVLSGCAKTVTTTPPTVDDVMEEKSSLAPSFEEVWPIFENNCIACHSSNYSQSDLVLETFDSMLAGGKLHGPALVPGNSSDSPMIQYMKGEKEPQMPPVGTVLEAAAIEMIAAWIDAMEAE